MNENEEVVNRKKNNRISEENDEDNRRMITTTARFSLNKKVAVRMKIKTCNEEPLVLKLEKGNNLIIFYQNILLYQITENTVSKINKIEHIKNEGQEGRIYNESIRKEKESRKGVKEKSSNIHS